MNEEFKKNVERLFEVLKESENVNYALAATGLYEIDDNELSSVVSSVTTHEKWNYVLNAQLRGIRGNVPQPPEEELNDYQEEEFE